MSKHKETLQMKIKGWVLNLHAGKYSVLKKWFFFNTSWGCEEFFRYSQVSKQSQVHAYI